MIDLSTIQSTVQDVAEAISAAIGLETEIVSTAHLIVAGTGRYYDRINTIEECGGPGTKEIYGTILRTGTEYIIEDAPGDPNYWGYENELAEICCPVKTGGRVMGVIGLVAFTEEQRERLIRRKETYLKFLRKMAFLIAGKVNEVSATNGMRTVLQSIHEGILAVDERGSVTECNLMAASLIGKKQSEIVGSSIRKLWRGTHLLNVVVTGKGYSDTEERYVRDDGSEMHFFCSAVPVRISPENEGEAVTGEEDGKCVGAVVSFRDIAEVRRMVYNLTEKKESASVDEIIGISAQMCRLKEQIEKIADSRSTVMITGESGTGKSLIAKVIHSASPRKDNPFVTVNCGAIPENLMESELFGYEAGSFTGASKGGKPGKFELASKGTIFLDEIGDLPLHLQVKLLHVLQTGKVERIGGSRELDVDVRVIVATNRDLEQMVADREFREDLYFRFNVIPFLVPPLRERKEDILLLLKNALEKYNVLLSKNIRGYEGETLAMLQSYHWPGNIRELENVVEYAVNMESGAVLSPESLPPRLRREEEPRRGLTLAEQCRDLEREVISRALERTGYSVEAKKAVARELGIGEATLYRKIKELGVGRK